MFKPTYENLESEVSVWIHNIMLSNIIKLKDVPRYIRISVSSAYVTAFRVSRLSWEQYLENLIILRDDILSLEDEYHFCKYFYEKSLMGRLSSALSKANIGHDITEERINGFERDLPESVLCELYRDYGFTQENIRIELEKRRIIKGKQSVT
jgi:hypothetical protein